MKKLIITIVIFGLIYLYIITPREEIISNFGYKEIGKCEFNSKYYKYKILSKGESIYHSRIEGLYFDWWPRIASGIKSNWKLIENNNYCIFEDSNNKSHPLFYISENLYSIIDDDINHYYKPPNYSYTFNYDRLYQHGGRTDLLYGYIKYTNNIHYKNNIIHGIDFDTFEIINSPNNRVETMGYAKDKDNVYFKGKKIEGIDPKTFLILSSKYIRDKKNIFYISTNKKVTFTKVKNVDLKTFSTMGDSEYSKDKNDVYYKLNKVKGVDIKTFSLYNYGYAEDKNNIYFKGKKIKGVDMKTFSRLSYLKYIKDKDSIYFKGKRVKGVDTETFVVLDFDYTKDKDNVFLEGEKVEGVDAKTFSVLYYGYTKDKNNVFYWEEPLTRADSDTFEVLKDGYAKDKNSIFLEGKKVEYKGVDIKTFSVLELDYTKDKNNIYFKGKKIKGADIKTFSILYNGYTKDKNNVFFRGLKINGINSSGFFQKSDGTYKKNGMYYTDNNIYAGIGDIECNCNDSCEVFGYKNYLYVFENIDKKLNKDLDSINVCRFRKIKK